MTEDLETSVPRCRETDKHLRFPRRHDAWWEFACAGRITNPSPLPPDAGSCIVASRFQC